MIYATDSRQINGLTIVSHSLLRASTKEWLEPTHLFKRIRGAALAEIVAELNNPKAKAALYFRQRSLLMFDCMLRVIDEPAISSVLELGTKRFEELQEIFYGALASDKFNALSTSSRISFARAFYKFFLALQHKFEIRIATFTPNSNKNLPVELANLFDNIVLNNDEVVDLKPYLLTDKAGEDYNVLLKPMVPHLGQNFTTRFHTVLRAIAVAKAKDTALRDFGTTFSRYVAAQSSTEFPVTEAKLKDREVVYRILVELMTYHFKKKYSMENSGQEGTMASLQKLWSRYELYWPNLVKAGIVAAPLRGFPKGKPSLVNVKDVRHQRKRRKADSPSETESKAESNCEFKSELESVTHKLLTPVPLHLSDEATTRLIFKQITKDFETIQSWLDNHLEKMWQLYQRGLALAGSESHVIDKERKLVDLLNPKKNSNALIEALRYFKRQHGGYADTNRVATDAYPDRVARGGISKSQLAPLLGVPNREDAMALIGYLASVDGRFSESALATAELHDRKGNRINAVNTENNTLTLSVYKDRAGSAGWHDVVISGRAYDHVQRWLELTAPLRAYMDANKIDGSHNLFIYASKPLGKPTFFTRTSNINSAFRAFAQRNFMALGELTDTVTIPRIRAQRGIIIFLEKFDVRAMARELGNDEDTAMRHYLPDAIWDYFTVRWIRIFQNLLIVEATRGTPYMEKTFTFDNATELDEFLRTHALNPLIPAEEAESDVSSEKRSSISDAASSSAPKVQEIMVAASQPIFAALLSVKDAVKRALDVGDEVNAKALYWYEFAKRLQNHIESDAFPDRGIKKLLKAAAAEICPDNYVKVIRA
ncbi:hypothetical protein ACFQ09_06955 [Massilia norwichensis]|uniref:Uncharacterized protein n=1 Tax=Massilia norwichensis TaxID=1442366 RepID=A0ABT2A924_9BURK|nr:hypothetical protein [Massilia norwichensis]MCS0590691.1 hypothetical protein [Massilia norwichensis]